MSQRLPIAITCGDPAGIGPEIITRWLHENPDWADRITVLGPATWLASLSCPVLACGDLKAVHQPGKPTDDGARTAWEALKTAAEGCLEGKFSSVVTGPVSKEALQKVGFPYPGQTEFFADGWKGKPSMAFSGEKLRVVLATWHDPLKSVPDLFRKHPDLLDRAVIRAAEWGRLEGIGEPRIAVCGLNPHAGESGLIGREEEDLLNPRLDVLRGLYPGVSRCLPADTVFYRMLEKEFDIIVALYHDQGLIPVKTLEFHQAVNLSLGLRFIRTSPDHGTAFHLAGKGIARTGSFHHAVELAWRYASLPTKVESPGKPR